MMGEHLLLLAPTWVPMGNSESAGAEQIWSVRNSRLLKKSP
jgi:hypothetical protein